MLQAWLSRSSLDEVESDSKRSEKVVDKLNRHSADGAAERYVPAPTLRPCPFSTKMNVLPVTRCCGDKRQGVGGLRIREPGPSGASTTATCSLLGAENGCPPQLYK